MGENESGELKQTLSQLIMRCCLIEQKRGWTLVGWKGSGDGGTRLRGEVR